MLSVIDRLKADAEEVKQLFTDLVNNHSSLKRWRMPGDILIIGMGDYSWNKLSTEGKQHQGRLLKKYRRFVSMVNMMIEGLPAHDIKDVHVATERVIETIEQNRGLFTSSKEEVIRDTLEEIDKQTKILDSLDDPTPGDNVYVPDTNALLSNPNIEAWTFDGVDKYTIVLTPTTLRELDGLKIDGKKTQEVRDKARTLIRKIKDYGRRGDIFEGVKLAGRNRIRSIAIEPDFDKALPALRPEISDDRLIATYFEVAREHPRSNVILVTDDIILQTKAAFFKAAYGEPPEIVQQQE